MRGRGGFRGFGRGPLFRGHRPLGRPLGRPLFRPWLGWAGWGCLLYPVLGLGGFLFLLILLGLLR